MICEKRRRNFDSINAASSSHVSKDGWADIFPRSNAVQFCRQTPTYRSNLLPSSSGQKKTEAIGYFEMLFLIYQNTRHQVPQLFNYGSEILSSHSVDVEDSGLPRRYAVYRVI